MERKLLGRLRKEGKVVLDTSFLLPYVGLRVKEIPDNVVELLKEVELYYPYAMISELIGVIFKVARKMGLRSIPELALRGFNSIVYGGVINLIYPVDRDLSIAYELIRSGLSDVFDAILYATSKRTGIKAVTTDKTLVDFLRARGFSIDNLILIT